MTLMFFMWQESNAKDLKAKKSTRRFVFVVTAPSSSPHRVFFERILAVYLVTVHKFIFKGVVSHGNRSFRPGYLASYFRVI